MKLICNKEKSYSAETNWPSFMLTLPIGKSNIVGLRLE